MTKGSELGTIVKSNIVDRVYERVGFTRQEAASAVDVVLDEIKAVLSQGESVRIVGFASFNLRERKPEMRGTLERVSRLSLNPDGY